MPQLLMPNIAGTAMQGFQQGQQMQANRLIGQAMQNPDQRQQLLGQAGSIDPRMALAAGSIMDTQAAQQAQAQQAQQDMAAKKLRGAALYAESAINSGDPSRIAAAQATLAPFLKQLTGRDIGPLDDPGTKAAMDQVLAQTAYLDPNATKAPQPYTLSPGGQRFDGNNRLVASTPSAPKITPQGYQAVLGPDGTYHAVQIPIQGDGNGMGVGQAGPNSGAGAPAQTAQGAGASPQNAPNIGQPAAASTVEGAPPGTQVTQATGPDGARVQFAFAPGTPDAVQSQTGAMAGLPQGAQPQQGAPQTLAQVIAAQKAGTGSNLIDQRAQQIRELKALGVQMTPEDEQAYLTTGKMGSDFQGGSSAALFGDPTLSGPKYLQSIPRGNQEIVRGLLDGTVALPTGTTLKNALWQSALASVKHADPGWNQAAYKQYADTRKWATTGQGGQLINNINTAAYHLDKLREDIEALNNGSMRPLNAVENYLSSATGGQAVTNFNADLTPVASELAAVYKGKGVPSDAEIAHFMTALTPNMSRGQQMNVIRGWIDLLAGKLNSTREQYQSGMSKLSTPLSVINPHAAEALERITTLANSVSNTGQHAMPREDTTPIYAPGGQQPQPAPSVGTIEQGYRFKGGDPANQANWEPVQ